MHRSFLLAALALVACSASTHNIAGTQIKDDPVNRGIITACEAYRVALEKKDAEGLLLMASPTYWERRGTVTGSDDYGFDGLRQVLTERLAQAKDIRFSMRYVAIRRACPDGGDEVVKGCRAHVEVLIDASFTVPDARGQERRPDKRDQNELVLEWSGDKWLFVSGM